MCVVIGLLGWGRQYWGPSQTSICHRLQVSEVCHASLAERRPGGRQGWQPRIAHIRCDLGGEVT